MAMALNN